MKTRQNSLFSFSKISFFGLWVYILFFSLFFDIKLPVVQKLFFLAVVILTFFSLFTVRYKIKRDSFFIIVFFFIVFGFHLVSTYFSPGTTFYQQRYIAAILTTLLLIYLSVRFREKDFVHLDKLLLIVAVISILHNVIILLVIGKIKLLFTGPSDSLEAYAVNTIHTFWGGGKNIYASKIFLTFIGVYAITKERGDTIATYILVLTGIAIYTTLSRTSFLAFLIFVFICYFKKRFILGYIVFSMSVGAYIIPKFFHFSMDANVDGGASRLILWSGTLLHLSDIPFFGYGLGNATIFITTKIGPRLESNVHNMILNTYIERGIFMWVDLIWVFGCIYLIGVKYQLQKSVKLALISSFLVVVFLQYLGYDNDLVCLFSLLLVWYLQKRRKQKYQQALNMAMSG